MTNYGTTTLPRTSVVPGMLVTGLKPGTILRARKESWLLGREYKHVAPGGHPKPTSECMYYIPEINRWIKNQPDPNFDL
ncbi:TPA: excisionase family protein [Salmonella enterica subsp. enterica serovar Eastbourne]